MRPQLGTVMQGPIGIYWDIVLLRRGPRDLPAAASLLVATLSVDIAINFVTAGTQYGAGEALARTLVGLALAAVVLAALLALRGRENRLVQTLTASFGTDVLLSLPALAVALITHGGRLHPTLAGLLSLPLFAWGLIVLGHILREALEVPLFNGVALAMSLAVLSLLIGELWPTAATR